MGDMDTVGSGGILVSIVGTLKKWTLSLWATWDRWAVLPFCDQLELNLRYNFYLNRMKVLIISK